MKKNKFKSKKKITINLFVVLIFIILVGYSLSLLLPFFWGVMNTFKHYEEFLIDPMCFPDLSLFKKFAFDEGYDTIFGNYNLVFQSMEYKYSTTFYTGILNQQKVTHEIDIKGPIVFFVFLGNTALTCFAGTVLPTFMCLIVAYLCAKYKFKFSGFIYALVIFSMAVPRVGNAATSLNLVRRLGIYDNMFGFFVMNCTWYSMYFLVFYSFFVGLSDSYIEAAEIDGASQLRVLISVIIPLAKTMISACFIMFFVQTWNDYSTPLMYLPTHPTLAYGIYFNTVLGDTTLNRVPIRLASLMFLAIPSLIFFILFRERLMGNISMGGVKE